MIRRKITLAAVLLSLLFTSVFTMSLNSQATSKAKVKSIAVINATNGDVTVAKGKKYKLDVDVYPENAKNKTLRYNSSNTKIVTVSSTGTLIAKKTGSAKITVKSKDNSKAVDTIDVTVITGSSFIALTKIKPSFKEISMETGDTAAISLTFKPANASNTNVIYSSSDEAVATVSDLGIITAVSAGEAKISVKSCDGSKVKTSIKVEVNDLEEDSENIDSDSEDSSHSDDSSDSSETS